MSCGAVYENYIPVSLSDRMRASLMSDEHQPPTEIGSNDVDFVGF